MSSLGSVCQSCTTPLRSLLYKTSGSRAEVVEVARLVPFETGVDTHKKPKRRTSTIQGTTQCFAFFSHLSSQLNLGFVFPLFFLVFFLPGGEGVFGRALTKRAWMPPNQPEEKNKTNEKGRKEEKGAGGAGGGQGVR